MMRYLIRDAGANLNFVDQTEAGLTPLSWAVRGNAATTKVLLMEGADPNRRDKYEQTPLFYAAVHKIPETTRLLVDYKADVNIQDQVGDTAMWYALHEMHNSSVLDRVEMCRVLVGLGLKLEIQNNKGETAVDVAKRKSLLVKLQQVVLERIREKIDA